MEHVTALYTRDMEKKEKKREGALLKRVTKFRNLSGKRDGVNESICSRRLYDLEQGHKKCA